VLRAGRRVYGSLIVSPSPRWPDTVAKLGLDFVFIDTEHIALDRAPARPGWGPASTGGGRLSGSRLGWTPA
jgi:hypothetical protein